MKIKIKKEAKERLEKKKAAVKKQEVKKPVKKEPDDDEKKEHALLSFWIIERKLMYYYPHLVDEKHHEELTVEDHEYDQAERRYVELCAKLKLPCTATFNRYGIKKVDDSKGMLQLEFGRPSVLMVLKRYGKKDLYKISRGSGRGIEWSEEMLQHIQS